MVPAAIEVSPGSAKIGTTNPSLVPSGAIGTSTESTSWLFRTGGICSVIVVGAASVEGAASVAAGAEGAGAAALEVAVVVEPPQAASNTAATVPTIPTDAKRAVLLKPDRLPLLIPVISLLIVRAGQLPLLTI